MADTYLATLPSRFTAGDSLALALVAADYSAADGWTGELSLMIPGSSTVLAPAMTSAEGTTYTWDILDTDTDAWAAGSYVWQFRVVNDDDESHTISRGSMEILPMLVAGADTRTYAEKCLAAIRAFIAGDLSQPVKEFRVGDATGYRMVQSFSPKELLELEAYWTRRVAQEQGKSAGIRMIPVRFVGA